MYMKIDMTQTEGGVVKNLSELDENKLNYDYENFHFEFNSLEGYSSFAVVSLSIYSRSKHTNIHA